VPFCSVNVEIYEFVFDNPSPSDYQLLSLSLLSSSLLQLLLPLLLLTLLLLLLLLLTLLPLLQSLQLPVCLAWSQLLQRYGGQVATIVPTLVRGHLRTASLQLCVAAPGSLTVWCWPAVC